MAAIVHTTEAIQTLLRHGLTPVTDNRDALVDLGFERAYPQIGRGYEATIWERAVDFGKRSHDGNRVLGRQRAILEQDAVAAA